MRVVPGRHGRAVRHESETEARTAGSRRHPIVRATVRVGDHGQRAGNPLELGASSTQGDGEPLVAEPEQIVVGPGVEPDLESGGESLDALARQRIVRGVTADRCAQRRGGNLAFGGGHSL